MQRTRLNNLFDNSGRQLSQFFANPWRRISLILLSFLMGFFASSSITTTFGQTAQIDVVMAAIMLLVTELISQWGYRRRPQNPMSSWGWDVLNMFKIGLVYGLYLEAFKVGS